MKLDHKSLLIQKYNSLIHWRPDYEEVGIQFAPSQKEIDKVVRAIKKIDPNWMTKEELDERKLEQLKYEIEDLENKLVCFGKYQGKHLYEVPEQYMKWALSNISDPNKVEVLFWMKELIYLRNRLKNWNVE